MGHIFAHAKNKIKVTMSHFFSALNLPLHTVITLRRLSVKNLILSPSSFHNCKSILSLMRGRDKKYLGESGYVKARKINN